MAAKQHEHTVGDYVLLQRGTTYKGSLVGKPGPALLGLGSIEPGGGFKYGDYSTYGGECPENLMLFSGDLYVALKGATKDGKMIGSVARVPQSVLSGRLTQDTVKLSFRDPNPNYTSYLYWVLRTPQYREYCAARAMGSAVVALSRQDFLSYPVPTLTSTRKRLVTLLEALDDKIELNRQMNATLEEMARSIFKSWFVDFDPVRAKAASLQPAGMDTATAALFPDRFETVAGREVPAGWTVSSLDRIASFLNGLALQNFPAEGADFLPVIKIAQMRKGHTEGSDRARTDIPKPYIVEDGDVLFSWSGSLEVVLWCGGRGALNQHLFKVTSDTYSKWFYYLWTKHHLDEFRAIAAGKVTTMGHIQRHHLTEAEVIIPTASILKSAEKTLSSLIEQIISNNLTSRTLATLRDTLLPKLLSGELRVRDEKRLVEIAV